MTIIDALIFGPEAFNDEQLDLMAEATVDYAKDKIMEDVDDASRTD